MPAAKFQTFKALGILLCYPTTEWQEGVVELAELINREAILKPQDRDAIRAFAADAAESDLFDLQEAYVDAFDRVRSLSLHLFEHVHGESRDRGQAMVDLAGMYAEHGYELSVSELPDYLPVFLEFLSILPNHEAVEMLGDPLHVIEALSKRLAERGAAQHVILDSLIRFMGKEPVKVIPRPRPEVIDFAAMDKEWEEKPIEFLGASAPAASAGGCGGGSCGGGGCGGGKPQAMEQRI